MDGTLLDLNFDNQFWMEHIPQLLSEKHQQPIDQSKAYMQKAYAEVYGKLQWYCLDYWADKLDLDIVGAKQTLKHLIRMRDDCIPFLDALKQSNRRVVLVTNAHPDSLSLKVEQTALDQHISTLVSTHQFGASKEFQSLWKQLQAYLDFDPSTTLFVDDSETILDAAKEFGIAYTLGITNPDSQQPEHSMTRHQTTNNYHELIESIIRDNFHVN